MKKLFWLIPIAMIAPGTIMLYGLVFGYTFSQSSETAAAVLGMAGIIVLLGTSIAMEDK